MARSRSSFELTHAIATASTLAREEKKKTGGPAASVSTFGGVALVSFQPADAPAAAHAPPSQSLDAPPASAPSSFREDEPPRLTPSIHAIPPPPPPPASSRGPESTDDLSDGKRRPPKLPDLSTVVSPIVRCEKIIEWIAEATSASGVFIADADGLPVAGDTLDAEARIGASGLVVSSIATLLQALPGQPSPLFEVHIGDGPFFQLIGFQAANGMYVVGLSRQEPLSPRQAHAIRLACRHAFGEPISGTTPGGRS
jgi:hypothetical protein